MVERIRALLETRQLTPTQFADLIGVARPIVSHILSGRNKPSLEVVQRILAALPELSMPWLLNGTGPIYAAAAATPLLDPIREVVPTPRIGTARPVPAAPLGAPAVPLVEPRQSPPAPAVASPPVLPPPVLPPLVPAQVPDFLIADKSETRRVVLESAGLKRFTPKATASPPEAAGAAATPKPPAPAPVPVPEPMPVPMPVPEPSAPVSAAPSPPSALNPDGAEPTQGNDASLATALFAGTDKPIRRIVIFYRDGSFADYQPE